MKRITLLSVLCLAVFGGANAADMTGDFNTWLGYIAGINAAGDRSTVQGAGAGGEATGLIRTDLIGAASGAYSSNLTDCVGIGYRALRGASDMSEVVAIGSGAFSNRTGLTKATWLNGQFAAFGQNNSFWIKANPAQADTNAPIHYANGVLSLNADTVRINGETAGGNGSGASAPVLAGFDLYVDPVNGDDAFPGTTPGTAKRTIDGAYATVTNHDVTICLLPGVHASPSVGEKGNNIPEYRVHYIGAYGKDKTIIDCGGVRLIFGSGDAFTSIKGCSIVNIWGKGTRARLWGLYLYDCAVDFSGGTTGWGIESCVVEKCQIFGTPCFSAGSSRLYSAFFLCSDVFDTVVDITPTEELDRRPSLIYASYLENVFFRTSGAVKHFGSAGDSEVSVLGNPIGMRDCTVICAEAVESFNVPPSVGCLFGLGSDTVVPVYSTLTGCVSTNAATIAAIIGEAYRPPVAEWRFRYVGYESAAERATRDSMENSIVDALLKNERLNLTPVATMSLLSLTAENEAANMPVVANRGTNSVPAGLKIELPPDPEE